MCACARAPSAASATPHATSWRSRPRACVRDEPRSSSLCRRSSSRLARESSACAGRRLRRALARALAAKARGGAEPRGEQRVEEAERRVELLDEADGDVRVDVCLGDREQPRIVESEREALGRHAAHPARLVIRTALLDHLRPAAAVHALVARSAEPPRPPRVAQRRTLPTRCTRRASAARAAARRCAARPPPRRFAAAPASAMALS